MMTDLKFSVLLVLCAVLICIASTQPAPEEDNLSASDWKKKGDEALKLKMLDVATDAYTKAIEKEPENYLYYYHRALVFSFRGRASLAIKDYTSTIERNPTHTTSFIKRGQLYMDIGNFDEAENDFTAATKLKGSTTAASDGLEKLFVARDLLKQLERVGDNHQQEVDILTALIQFAPACEKYLLLRAEAYMRLDNFKDAISDGVSVLRINPRNMDAHWLIGKANFLQADYEYALQAYKKALSFDPENKLFIKQIKLTKQITKGLSGFNENFQSGRWEEALEFYNNLIQSAEGMDKNTLLVERSCKCLLETKKYKEAIDACTKALAQNSGLFEAQMWRGEAHMMLDDFQAARNDFQGASQVNPHDHRLQQAYQRLERKEKMAARKDYYKILGIPKDAQPAQIKKAYRKLALEFHPDKHTDKVAAEIKFQEITEAYEIIGDEEKRGKYDRGEDLQPRQQQHNPFQHGFPFKFSFH